jgi:hypothetical protein
MSSRDCNICGIHFEFPYLLERHINGKRKCKLRDIQDTTNICNYCNNNFATKYTLTNHFKICKKKKEQENNIENNIENNNKEDTQDNIEENIKNNIENNLLNSSNNNNTVITNNTLDKVISLARDILNARDDLESTDQMLLGLINYLQNTNNVENLNNSLSIIKDNKDNKVKNIQNNNNSRTNTLNNTLNNILNQNQIQNSTINSNSNNNNNSITNNNITLPNIINPFGCEDISFITDDEKLQILKSSNGVELALEKIYSKPENRNFYKPNANKDNVSVLNKDMKIQVKKQKQFNEQMINHGVLVMERMFYTCKNRLSFADQLLIWNNIEENRELLRFESNLTTILSVMETCFQDAISKEIFKKFSDKINREETFRLEKLNIVKELLIELERFNNDRNNITIDDDFLRTEVWTKEEHKQSNVDGSEPCNNLALRHMENTPRYNFFQEMKSNEFEYFDMHGASIGNIIEYRKILLQRAKAEIDRISDEYKNHSINENNNLANEIADKLINEPRLQMRVQLSRVKFINDTNLIEQ